METEVHVGSVQIDKKTWLLWNVDRIYLADENVTTGQRRCNQYNKFKNVCP